MEDRLHRQSLGLGTESCPGLTGKNFLSGRPPGSPTHLTGFRASWRKYHKQQESTGLNTATFSTGEKGRKVFPLTDRKTIFGIIGHAC